MMSSREREEGVQLLQDFQRIDLLLGCTVEGATTPATREAITLAAASVHQQKLDQDTTETEEEGVDSPNKDAT